ncbi:MAG: hypothetical protein ACJ8F7_16040 [Gemmataceae bacterium]
MSDFDSPWKEAMDEYFPAFIELLFPAVHAAVDWDRGYERPDHYARGLLGCNLEFRFPIVKLLDFGPLELMLEQSPNPFAQVVLAHLKTLETRDQPQDRLAWKLRLIKGLFERGWAELDIRRVIRLIDWLMDLPPELGPLFWQDIETFKKEKHVPFVTTFERFGRLEGKKETYRESIAMFLRSLFGDAGEPVIRLIQQIPDEDRPRDLLERLYRGATLDEIKEQLPTQSAS